jgi:hypothetical protein
LVRSFENKAGKKVKRATKLGDFCVELKVCGGRVLVAGIASFGRLCGAKRGENLGGTNLSGDSLEAVAEAGALRGCVRLIVRRRRSANATR